jgi:hypothetical protein
MFKIKKYKCKLNIARHNKQRFLIAAEGSPLLRTTIGFDLVIEMRVSVTRRLVRQRSTFGNGPIYTVFSVS